MTAESRKGHPNLKNRKPGPRRQRAGLLRLSKATKHTGKAERTMLTTGSLRDDKAVAALFDAKAELKKHTPAAIEKLVALMDSKDERVAFSAAREILDRNLGKPGIAEDQSIGTVHIKWIGDGQPRHGEHIDLPSHDWNSTVARAIERSKELQEPKDDDDDLTQTELEN